MKIFLLITTVITLGLSKSRQTPSDFDNRLIDIAQEFRNVIMNEDECENLNLSAYYLVEELEDASNMKDKYSYEEILELKKLKKEASALEKFIATVGDCKNSFLSIEEFVLGNQRVNANLSYVIKDAYCVDIILVQIDDYAIYLAENSSAKDYKISYKWKGKNGSTFGNGEMGISKSNIRQISNNREEIAKKNILFSGIKCIEF